MDKIISDCRMYSQDIPRQILCAKLSGAVYCYRSCLGVCVTGGRAVSVTTITRNYVHRSSPNWVYRCG